jgi:2-amino-4-hydroxy-6-hydroxymethyldihydropteridine diphosphokinase
MSEKHLVYLSLGSNVKPRTEYLAAAIDLLKKSAGKVLKKSAFYETGSWGFVSETPFVNNVVLLETTLNATDLLKKTQEIERLLGREKKGKPYTSRKIDIDILYYDDSVINNGILTVPHALLQKRKFVLVPLAEIAPDTVHPVLKKSSLQMLDECDDNSLINKL